MEPHTLQPETQTTPQASTPTPMQSYSQTQKPKKKVGLLLIILLFLALTGGCTYLYMQLASSKKAHKATQAQLETTGAKLKENEAKLKPVRDLRRKKDLSLLKFVIQDYKRSTGKFYTTEGTQSRQIFESSLVPKIPDFKDPTSDKQYGYEAIAAVHTPSPLQLGVIQYQWLGKCAADGDFTDTTSEDFAAIRTVLESGETYCLDL